MPTEQPDALISMSAVMRLISVTSRTTVYRYLQENPDFPKRRIAIPADRRPHIERELPAGNGCARMAA